LVAVTLHRNIWVAQDKLVHYVRKSRSSAKLLKEMVKNRDYFSQRISRGEIKGKARPRRCQAGMPAHS